MADNALVAQQDRSWTSWRGLPSHQRRSRTHQQREQQYALYRPLDESDNDYDNDDFSPANSSFSLQRTHPISHFTYGLISSVSIGLLLFLLTLFLLAQKDAQYSSVQDAATNVSDALSPQPASSYLLRPAYLHVLITAQENGPRASACRSLLSAGVLGYPTPVLLDWDRAVNVDETEVAARLRAKAEWLGGWDDSHDEDVVVVLEAPDSWLQLRPQVLLDRFFAKMKSHELSASEEARKQDVLFAGRRSLSEDPGDLELDAGVIVAKLRSLKIFIDKAQDTARRDLSLTSEEAVFARLYGSKEFDGRKRAIQDHQPGFGLDQLNTNGEDFGVGLDENEDLALHQSSEEITAPQLHDPDSLPNDVSHSLPPFWTQSLENLPRHQSWSLVQLISNIRHPSASTNLHIPVIVRGTQALWPTLWFQSHARRLYDARMYDPIVATGYGARRAFWPAELWQGGARSARENLWLRFDDVCQEAAAKGEVFTDERGGWELPPDH